MINRIRIAAVLVAVAALASSAAAVQDPSTGKDAIERVPFVPLPVRSGATEVLWDTTHGVCFGYEPTQAYADLVSLLVGFNFTTTNAGLDNIDLSPYQILVICAGSACKTTYTASEVTAVQAFVALGGSVLILGDNPYAWVWNINPLAQSLGALTGVADLQPSNLYFSNLASHPIFNGITTLYYIAGGSLSTTGVMHAVGWTDSGTDITIDLSESPCVVVLGDINAFAEPEYLNQADNRAFAVNVFNWLASCGPVSIDNPSWGSIKSTYR